MVDTLLNAVEVLTHFILRRYCQLRPGDRQEAEGECDDNSNSSEKRFQGAPSSRSSKHASPRPFRTALPHGYLIRTALPHGYLIRQVKVNPGGPTSNRLMAPLPRRCHSSARNALPCLTDSVLRGNAAASKTALKWHFLCDLPGLPEPLGTSSAFYALRRLRFLPPLIPGVFGSVPLPPRVNTGGAVTAFSASVPTDQHRLQGPVWTHELRGSVPHLHISVFMCELGTKYLSPRAPE